MQGEKDSSPSLNSTVPIWCSSCFLRISPYDLSHVQDGKNYHRTCFRKISIRTKAAKQPLKFRAC
jgi:hypothetical protein